MGNAAYRAADKLYGLNREEAMGINAARGSACRPGSAGLADGDLAQHVRVRQFRPRSSGLLRRALRRAHSVRQQTAGMRSLPESELSRLMLGLTTTGQVVTGTWTEQTDPDGYYAGRCITALSRCSIRPRTGWLTAV